VDTGNPSEQACGAECAAERRQPPYFWRIPAGSDHGFMDQFRERCGVSPQYTFRILVCHVVLWSMSGVLLSLVGLNYTRYYITNDLVVLSRIETYSRIPTSLMKAFLYPFLGGISDRVARRSILLASNVTGLATLLLFVFVPCVPVLLACRLLNIVSDCRGMATYAMLRDLFPTAVWDHEGGGYTQMLATLVLIGNVSTGVAGFAGLVVLYFVPDEFQQRHTDCSPEFCTPPGQFGWDSPWAVDGALRGLALASAAFGTAAVALIAVALPETLPPQVTAFTVRGYVRRHWRDIARPWDKLRPFSTRLSRVLLADKFLHMVISTGGMHYFWCWARRFKTLSSDSLLSATVGAAGTVGGGAALLVVPHLVGRLGDIRGIWLTSDVLTMCFAISVILLPEDMWVLQYGSMLLFAGPGFGLQTSKDGVLGKLMPPNLQATWRTGKNHLYDVQNSFFGFFYQFLFEVSEDMGYPFDVLPILVPVCIGSVAMAMTVYAARYMDPKGAIEEGRALEAFYASDYARGPWYTYHTTGVWPRGREPEPLPTKLGGGA